MSYDTEAHRRASHELLQWNSIRKLTFVLIIAVACLRFAHVNLLWADEDYHLAAALNILHGKVPYRDFWYDKPPLAAFYYLLIGAHAGWLLRLLDAAYVLAACAIAYKLARNWWGEAEGVMAAFLVAFSLAFYIPPAVIAFAADALMLVPHLGAVYYAQRRSPLAAGACCAVAFFANPKAVFVLATCGLWLMPLEGAVMLAGFAVPVLLAYAAAKMSGAWAAYVEQVWHWGFLYTKGTPVEHPVQLGASRTSHWLAFHSAASLGAVYAFLKSPRSDQWKLAVWIVCSFAGVALGSRFAPHYFLQLVPPIALAGARGMVLAWRRYGPRAVTAFGLLALIPFIRFAPRYAMLAADNIAHRDPRWTDVVMDLDSQKAAAQIRKMAHPGDTLMVWGYRPDIYVYTRLVSDGRFWDSQPLTGVAADRHLKGTTSIYGEAAVKNREAFSHTRPTFLVDGLGLMNPRLAPDKYPELRDWLAHYKLVTKTRLSLIYKRVD
jgi:hypothetical protein